jgi:hypothetical protein
MTEITVERLERAQALCAYLVVLDGPVAIPWFERLEREVEAARKEQDSIVRAKALLERGLALPRYVERNHRNGILSFRVGRGACIPLPDLTTSEFRAAYTAALVEAIARENDSDE